MQQPLEEHHFEKALSKGITRVLLHQRYYQSLWDIERATTEPVTPRNAPSEVSDLVDVAIENGISRATYYRRVDKGMSPEEASTKPTAKRGRPRKRVYTDEQLEIANSNGVSKQCLDGRLRRKWELERAIIEPPLEFWQRNTGEKAQVFVSRKQRSHGKSSNPTLKDKVSKKQERWTKQYKALEDYAKELHCAAYGRSDRMLGGIRRDRSNSKLNKEKKILQSRHIEGVTL